MTFMTALHFRKQQGVFMVQDPGTPTGPKFCLHHLRCVITGKLLNLGTPLPCEKVGYLRDDPPSWAHRPVICSKQSVPIVGLEVLKTLILWNGCCPHRAGAESVLSGCAHPTAGGTFPFTGEGLELGSYKASCHHLLTTSNLSQLG